jgi:hypothetical protein
MTDVDRISVIYYSISELRIVITLSDKIVWQVIASAKPY